MEKKNPSVRYRYLEVFPHERIHDSTEPLISCLILVVVHLKRDDRNASGHPVVHGPITITPRPSNFRASALARLLVIALKFRPN